VKPYAAADAPRCATCEAVPLAKETHWVAEETPEEMLAALTAFLAPYRDEQGAARTSAPPAAAG
jgi:hypothetical protein